MKKGKVIDFKEAQFALEVMRVTRPDKAYGLGIDSDQIVVEPASPVYRAAEAILLKYLAE